MKKDFNKKNNENPLYVALIRCKKVFWVVFGMAFCINILMLLTSFYSLQVLDRVVGSGNLSTLLMLSIVFVMVYFTYGLLQIARSFTLIKVGEWLDIHVSPLVFSHSIASAALRPTLGAGQLLRDFQTVKSFFTSVGINTILDMPWTLVYLAVIFIVNSYIGLLTVVGGCIIILLALFNAVATNKALGRATEDSLKSISHADIAGRNAEVVEAMGMIKNVSKNWHKHNAEALKYQSMASYRNGIISNLSRFIRNAIQMSVTAIGAYFVVSSGGRDMTTGGMILSSILVGRALAPFDNFIELWKSISSTMKSYKRINESFHSNSLREDAMPLPNIVGKLDVVGLSYAIQPQGNNKQMNHLFAMPKYILQDVSFSLSPGEILAIIGHSAAGKSSLAKIITGVWKASGGSVKLDGGEIYRWNREDFGRHIGYLPQGIELFSGTIKQNIARMSQNISPEQIVDAAKLAGAHDMILSLANGYDTDIGIAGSNLSGGQKQRIALARAFYGDPKLVVLDEPNANLDEAGENALAEALIEAKKRGMSIVVISHRPSILKAIDKILILNNGKILSYGDKEKVISHITTQDIGTMHIE